MPAPGPIITERTLQSVSRDMLEREQPNVIAHMFGGMRDVKRGEGQNLSLRRIEKLATAQNPLTPGVNPEGKTPTWTDVTARIEEYGDWIPTYSTVADTNGDPVIRENSAILSDQAFETLDMLTWGVLLASTNVFYANEVANYASVVSPILAKDLDWIIATLETNNAKELTSLQKAGPNIDTHPIAPSFCAVAHPYVIRNLRALGTSFIRVQNYARNDERAPGEQGVYEKIRFFSSTQLAPSSTYGAGGADTAGMIPASTFFGASANDAIFPVLIFGMNAYDTVGLQGKGSIQTHIHQPGEAGSSDPLDRMGSMGWTAWHTAVITNNSWMALYWCTANDQNQA